MPDSPEVRRRRVADRLRVAAATLNALKLARGCTDCGYRTHPAALQFDHIDPSTKTRELGWRDDRSKLITTRRLLAFIEHVDKYCEIRCANCHAERTMHERHYLPVARQKNEPPTLF